MKNILSLCLLALLLPWLTLSCVTKAPQLRAYLLDPLPADTPYFDVSISNLLNSKEMRYTTENREVRTIPHARWALPIKEVCASAIPPSYSRPGFTLHVIEVQNLERSHTLVYRTTLYPRQRGERTIHGNDGERRIVYDGTQEKIELIPLEISIPYEGDLDALAFRKAFSQFLCQAGQRITQLQQENPPPQNPAEATAP